ncbi:MAG: DUF2726 domain-containing protein [Cellvibrio sp.]
MEWLIFAAVCLFVFSHLLERKIKTNRRAKRGSHSKNLLYSPPKTSTTQITTPVDVTSNALKIATTHKYFPKQLLNQSERQIYLIIKQIIDEIANEELILHVQAPLGEFLHTKNKYAYGTINFKRVDFLITDSTFKPLLAIEYNGSGHYDNNALERDEIKRSAVESANIKFLSIRQNADAKHLIRININSLLVTSKLTEGNS